ncbi:MAG: UvrD-helicase domain-containing protein, partial [Actinobacteria bacterium]|nr:UvrD-helicase domain-containing protein [Actinomycetota bacterium]
MPELVRQVVDVPGETGVTQPNPEQLAAIEAPGVVFLSAGAGTGKTTVLVERFVRAVCDRGLSLDSVLAITYTERAAGELRARIRERLGELGREDLARELDSAWISTIHGFCLRLLKAHPFAAGLDPRFRVLDESQGRILRGEAFQAALAEFCAGDDPARLGLLTTYGKAGLRRMLTRVYETLRSAGRPLELVLGERAGLAEATGALREAAGCVGRDPAAPERQVERVARLLALVDERPEPEQLLDLSDFAARGERLASYNEARRALEQAALNEVAARDRDLLQELLQRFAEHYRAAKEAESALDFEDLQLQARDLLRTNETIRDRERWRFRSILVDEFQDTNRLQCELVDLLSRPWPAIAPAGQRLAPPPPDAPAELFFVGDEFQSIYGFRHADVEVFRERRAQTGGVLALTHNYRSRPEVLDVINHLFSSDFGDQFQPLEAAGRFSDPAFGPAVELLVTDKKSYDGSGVHWRRAEARHIACRVHELVDSGEAELGEVVLLFAAGTDAELYEEELRARGLPTFRATGRGYFGQQQVVDLLAYLRLLQNRYDDEALVTVLASPFVGVSNDAFVLLRRAAPKRPLFTGLERELPEGLSPRDERLFQAFRQRYDRLVAGAATVSLERLCEQIVTEHDYDLAVLAQWDGRRRYANLRKLARLARSYEELRGTDIEGFVRFVREHDSAGAKELEALAEEEGADAVRLLTIHSAKGLEFKVVVVADAGRDRRGPDSDEILCLPDGRFGFRVADPATGKRRGAFDYQAVKDAERQAEEEERRRLYYVAMTRAIDRLVVSGAYDRERKADETTPIGWVLGRLEADELEDAAGPVPVERDGATLVLRVDRFRAEPEPEPVATDGVDGYGQLSLFAAGEPDSLPLPAPRLPPFPPVPHPPANPVRRLSYSALALFERCSYRFYSERIAGLHPVAANGVAARKGGLAATEIGDAVHGILEHLNLRAPQAPEAMELEHAVRARYPAASDDEIARIGGFVAGYLESDLARRVAALPGAVSERPFTFEHDGVLLHGRIDVF